MPPPSHYAILLVLLPISTAFVSTTVTVAETETVVVLVPGLDLEFPTLNPTLKPTLNAITRTINVIVRKATRKRFEGKVWWAGMILVVV